MASMDSQVQQAISLFKAGRKEEARAILMEVVDKDERNEQAWLWLSAMVDSLEEQQICLENVLSINPSNERAHKGLETVSQKIAAQNSGGSFMPLAPPPPTAPPSSRAGGGMPIGAEFASFEPPPPDSTFDSWLSKGTDSAPFKSSSSVDWSRPDTPAAYGSGKNIDLPSAQEYDSWLQNLNLGAGGTSESRPSFESGTSQFGDTSFMVDSGPFEPDAAQVSSNANDPFGRSLLQPSESPSWDEQVSPESPVSPQGQQNLLDRDYSAGTDNRAKVSAFSSPFGSFGDEPSEEEMRFDFDDDAGNDEFASVFGGEPSQISTDKTTDYYQYIPSDIEALSSGGSGRKLLTTGGVIVLGVLNLAAIAFLLMGLAS